MSVLFKIAQFVYISSFNIVKFHNIIIGENYYYAWSSFSSLNKQILQLISPDVFNQYDYTSVKI